MSSITSAIGLVVVVNSGTTYSVQPASGVEWIVHNFFFSGTGTLNKTDGTNTVSFYTVATSGSALSVVDYHVTNTEYLSFTSTAISCVFAFDGIRTV